MSCRRRACRAALVAALGLALAGAWAAPPPPAASPYHAAHAGDPVRWHGADHEARALARADNRLLLVSTGYLSCHWCHVMGKESFADDEVAAVLNRDFVPVLVDRELEPVLDAQLLAFAERTGAQAGWPLQVFVTPAGHPLFATGYLPRADFLRLLEQVAMRWRQRGPVLAAAAARLHDTPAPAQRFAIDAARAAGLRQALLSQASVLHDDFTGGFGAGPQHPRSPALLALLSLYRDAPSAALGDMLTRALTAMAAGGLYDHVGGGFFRYTTDAGFVEPHFEKMLTDNVLLARLYLRAEAVFPGRGYGQVARETLAFLHREMRSPHGGLIASLSAVDGDGVDGGYYRFDDAALASVLAEDERRVVRARCTVGAAPPGGYLLRCHRPLDAVAANLGITPAAAMVRFEAARARLLSLRQERVLPRDGKRLAAWNGLALSTFSEAARVDGRAEDAAMAREIRDYLVGVLWSGETLARAEGGGRAALSDYALVARGLWDHDGNRGGDRRVAEQVLQAALGTFRVGDGWRDGDAWLAAPPPVARMADGALPSATAVLGELAADMARLHEDAERRALAADILLNGDEQLAGNAFFHATAIRAATALAR